jgi:tRNA1Val (adenine37-N6)-methyltransferase
MTASNFPKAYIHAIDLDREAVQLALLNVANAGQKDRIKVSNENILEPAGHEAQLYDLVLSNPPFYKTQILPMSESKAMAKHSTVPESLWISGMQRRVKESGNLCIIVPGESAIHWIREANACGYYNLHRLDVYSFMKDTSPVRSLLHFVSSIEKPVIRRLNIYKEDNTFTAEYLQLTGIRVSNKTAD